MLAERSAIERSPLRWLSRALLALLLIFEQLIPPALTPTGPRSTLVPVCSATGLIWLDPATGQPAAPASDQRPFAHLCCLWHHGGVLPPKPLAVVARRLPVQLRWRLPSPEAARPTTARRCNQPRAPPLPSAMI
jgi:hypothetical protein